MAVVVSLQELVDEVKIIIDEHHVFLNKVTGKTATLTDENISAAESGGEGSKLPEMTVAMIEEFWMCHNKEKTKNEKRRLCHQYHR